jgi:hypothetical protein
MLPGSPYRVTGGHGPLSPGEKPKEPATPDPTTNKPNETNPFTGESPAA